MPRRIVVVGAGIVGASLALELAGSADAEVTVLDRDAGEPRGSTAYAPGFVGLYNDSPVLTRLARTSAETYARIGTGFRVAGGIELATSGTGAQALRSRVEGSARAGLPAAMLDPNDVPAEIAAVVERECLVAAARFDADGVADPRQLLAAVRAAAEGRGAAFLGGQEVVGLDAGRVRTASGDTFTADEIVLATGVWGAGGAALTGLDLPIVPVAHPYVYSSAGDYRPGPFVRWPEHHVYARVHNDRLGYGTYDHVPVPMGPTALRHGARLPWNSHFDASIEKTQRLLNPDVRFAPQQKVNGVFAMTPDNLPFVGPHPSLDHVWIAQAIWVTHAAGAAAALADAIRTGRPLDPALRVDRFAGADPADLRREALRLYRDIYAHSEA